MTVRFNVLLNAHAIMYKKSYLFFDAAVIIQFSPANYIVPEGEERNLRIVKVEEASIAVSVLISTMDGTASGMLRSFNIL